MINYFKLDSFFYSGNIISMTTYKSSGVDILAADELIEENIKPLAQATSNPGVLRGVGGFGSVFDISSLKMKDPLLVTTTDGVGTKLLIAIEANNFKGIGQDLVAMCVNDLIAMGATPSLFLDYYATAKLDKNIAAEIIRSIANACILSNCGLVGGETAEMPGLYKDGDLDLAGFAIGFVERENLLPKTLNDGDVIIGLPSNGVHSNGFSLVREVIKNQKLDLLHHPAPWNPDVCVATALLEPTTLYVDDILGLQRLGILKAAAHITGGGLAGNLSRVIDNNHRAIINCNMNQFYQPPIFRWLSIAGNISEKEMMNVFNCGIGMVVVVSDGDTAMNYFNNTYSRDGGGPTIIGKIGPRENKSAVEINGSFRLF